VAKDLSCGLCVDEYPIIQIIIQIIQIIIYEYEYSQSYLYLNNKICIIQIYLNNC